MSREPSAEERETCEWIDFKDKMFEMQCREKGWLRTYGCTATPEELDIMFAKQSQELLEDDRAHEDRKALILSALNQPNPSAPLTTSLYQL